MYVYSSFLNKQSKSKFYLFDIVDDEFIVLFDLYRNVYLRKNSEPSGKTTRRSDGTSGVPL